MPSWRRNRRYVLILAGVSVAILVLGALFRPRETEGEGIAPVAQADMARLERLTVRNNVYEIARYFADLATLLEGQILRLQSAGRSAVVWGSDRVVSSGGRTRPPSQDRALGRPDGELELTLLRFIPNRPVTVYEASSDAGLSAQARSAAVFYTAGGWTMAAWRDRDGELSYELGQYLGSADADCDGFTGAQLRLNIDLTKEMLGGAVFDYDGALMGLIAACSGELIALDAATVQASLAAPQQVEDRLAGGFGLVVGALSEQEREALGVHDGVLIRQLWRGYQASAAGLLPGDVIVALDGKPVKASADLERMTLPIAREVFDLTVLRAGREREIMVKARPDPKQRFGAGGVAWTREAPGLPIGAVDPQGRLAKAGVKPGDRLLRIDGRPAESAAAIEQALTEDDGPIFAVFEREGRLWGALI